MSTQKEQLEAERKDAETQLELIVASLKDDPDNGELQTLKVECEQMIQMIDETLAELAPKSAPQPKKASVTSPPPEQPKWSKENHPAFQKKGVPEPAQTAEEKEPEVIISYQVNDTVMAKWLSGDKGFYPARITSVTGSSSAPIYTVKFKSYDTVETLRAKDIKPMPSAPGAAAQKRKADGISSGGLSSSNATPVAGSGGGSGFSSFGTAPSGSSNGGTANNNGIVLSAGAEMYPQAQQQLQKEGDEKPKPKFKKIKATKELEAGKNKWQEFNAKGKVGKAVKKKESMFRTPEGVRGRVGFTGSGQAMRKDPTRSRHVYQPNEDLD